MQQPTTTPVPKKTRVDELNELVEECFLVHRKDIIVNMIAKLENEYRQLAKLATCNRYTNSWSHEDVLGYVSNIECE